MARELLQLAAQWLDQDAPNSAASSAAALHSLGSLSALHHPKSCRWAIPLPKFAQCQPDIKVDVKVQIRAHHIRERWREPVMHASKAECGFLLPAEHAEEQGGAGAVAAQGGPMSWPALRWSCRPSCR